MRKKKENRSWELIIRHLSQVVHHAQTDVGISLVNYAYQRFTVLRFMLSKKTGKANQQCVFVSQAGEVELHVY